MYKMNELSPFWAILSVWVPSCIFYWVVINILCSSCLLKLVLFAIFFVFVVLPITYRSSYTLQKVFLFLNFVKWPPNLNLSNPTDSGLKGVRNFYLTGKDNVNLGVWHILPTSLIEDAFNKSAGEELFNEWLGNGRPIIVYAHGNSGHRGAGHRVQLYQVLQKSNYHVICFDYRGYGDSSDIPIDETGLVEDTLTVYRWAQNVSRSKNVFLWGHSLGTGISSHALNVLHSMNNEPDGLVLESPFNNLKDEVTEHPFSKIFRIFPWFDFFFTTPMYENGLRFESDKNLQNTSASILILHAKDDKVVPYKLGVRLYESVLKKRQLENDADSIQMVSYAAEKHYGHKFICEDPDLPQTIEDFMQRCLKRKSKS